MQYKLLASDFDNTLVPFGEPCPRPAVVKAVKKMQAAGGKFVLSTGRGYCVINKQQLGGIRFDYDLLAGSVTVYDYHAEPMQQKTVTDFAQGRGLGFLNEQDRRKLSKAISRATPEAPDVVLPVMVQRDGKPRLHRMALHTIWSGAGVRRCVNVLGQLTDEQHRVEHQAELLTALDPEEDPAHFLRRLQGIFDVVRLVDPGHRKVLTLDSDGILTEKPGSCHMVWNRDTRCENCISAKAYARKTILNKIEFKDEEAYFVISKYIEVGGRGCMLELVTRLTDGRWTWAATGCCWTAATEWSAAPS